MTSQAKNELEKLLIKAQAGVLTSETFMSKLMGSQLFIPINEKHEVGGLQTSNETLPLIVKDKSGVEVLILFTSPERAKNFVKDFPGYEGGLLAEFKWITENMGEGRAISINPDHELGFDLEAVMVDQITKH
ncbi:MAG: SseB family protein [Thiotrichaceae bacterium]